MENTAKQLAKKYLYSYTEIKEFQSDCKLTDEQLKESVRLASEGHFSLALISKVILGFYDKKPHKLGRFKLSEIKIDEEAIEKATFDGFYSFGRGAGKTAKAKAWKEIHDEFPKWYVELHQNKIVITKFKPMKIVGVKKVTSFLVETDKEENMFYTRYSADSWGIRMGESEEVEYDCAEIEGLYQQWKSENSKPKNKKKVKIYIDKKKVLIHLICGVEPNYSIFENELVKACGTFNGSYGTWSWNKGKLKELKKKQLAELYLLCRESWKD